MRTTSAPVLGIPVQFESDSPQILALAESSFGQWRSLAPEFVAPNGVTVRVELSPELRHAPPGVRYQRVGASRLELSGAARGWADSGERRAELVVGATLLERPEQLRYQVIEAGVLFLITGPDRFPVHASAVVKDGAALLLAGRSGAGKSTLAWLAGQAGWDVLSDDIVYVQTDPVWRLWGGGGTRSYLAAGAERFVAELASRQPVLRDQSRAKYALDRRLPLPPFVERAALCLLERGPAVRATHLERDAALATLVTAPEPGFDVLPFMAARALSPLASRAVRLEVGGDPRAGLPELEEIRRAFFA